MKRFRETLAWKMIRTVLEILAIAFAVFMLCTLFAGLSALAETETKWVICHPDDVVIVREQAKKKSFAISELPPGTEVITDGKVKNGYIRIVNMASESGSGWMRTVYLVDEEPEAVNRTATVISKGRLAARRCIGGERVRWLKPGQTLTVWFRTSEWCVTDKGYVQTKYLRVDGDEE